MFVSGGAKRLVDKQILRFAHLVGDGCEGAFFGTPAESGAGLDRQMVCRNVLDAGGEHPVERPPQRVAPESRNAEDQIGREVRETRLACQTDRRFGLCSVVAAVHQPQAVVVERLHADRQPVDPRTAQRVEVGGSQIVGIGLEGGLFHFRTVKYFGGRVEQRADRLGRAERRRAAPEVAGAHRFAAEVAASPVQLALHRCDDSRQLRRADLLEEVAVGADALAEGDMKVDACHKYLVYTALCAVRAEASACGGPHLFCEKVACSAGFVPLFNLIFRSSDAPRPFAADARCRGRCNLP